MRLMSWNVGLESDIFRKVMCVFEPKNVSIKKICLRINKENPDIIALQEIYKNDFNILSELLESSYPYYIHNPELGLCFFSKPKLNI